MYTSNESRFSIGEQSKTIRKQFWRSDFKQCPMCKSPNIAEKRWLVEIRHNGDACGTIVYQCLGEETVDDIKDLEWIDFTKRLEGRLSCGFFTSYFFDENIPGDDRYETHGWTKEESY
ncbi:unnamed protein product [Adineta steineri]|uniref:Uncharacterized protein n=1 Tax=Adineta steineri TaxID=433720 RepID=A0A819NB37_9BILA|nr:unnamed protein product [Adineta steineri]CAF1432534.1 unnamed protein product [Adineta steineri]CAF3993166.1 unnamed protein product [Adineta steineri]CAF4221332.1 unnamed protein product [Adineta steineri]